MRYPTACVLALATMIGCIDSSGLGSDVILDASFDSSSSSETAAVDSEGPETSIIDSGTETVPDTGSPPDTEPPPPDTEPPPMDADAGCTLTTCGSACVDTNSDLNNCGSCGKLCSSTLKFSVSCTAGACACATDEKNCGGSCTTVREDAKACSGCGTSCAKDEYCRAGACECRPGLSMCGGDCVDKTGDLLHCGVCGTACTNNERCVAGACVSNTTDCPAGRTACSADKGRSSCFNLKTDATHCGACGTLCNADELCVNGACRRYVPAAGCTTCGGCATCTTLLGSGAQCCAALVGHTVPTCVDGPACP